MTFNDITWLQVENSTRCNAWCPGCARNIEGYQINPELVIEDLESQRLLEVLELLPNLCTVQFCGTYGDTMAAQNVLEHIDVAKRYAKKIQIHTHGGIRSVAWWADLAKSLIDYEHDVWFALDGLEGVHEIYRQGTSFKKTIANAESFINHGGYATWQFIPWAHNEHQIRDCMKLSSSMGFKKFKLVRAVNEEFTGRHYRSGEIIKFHPWSQSNSTNPLKQIKNDVKVHTSDCRHLVDKMIYLNANGRLSPCCYLNHYGQFQDHEFPDLAQEIQLNPRPRCLKICSNGAIIKAHR